MIIFVVTFSKIFLKRQYYKHHILGVILVIIGLAIVGTFAYLATKKNSSGDVVELVGLILLL